MARTTGSFANPNHFAGYLEVTISLGIGLIIAMEGSREVSTHRWIELVTGPRGRLRIVLIIMVVGLVMSRSRMGNMGFLISLILTSGIALIIARKLSWKTIALLTSIIIIDVAIIGSYFGLERIGERLQQAPVDMVKRVELQSYNLQVVKDHTLTGTGAGTYEMVMPRYRDQHIARKPTHAENDYFEFVIELGLIGCIPLITLLGLGMYHQARLLKPGNPQHFRGLAFGCMMGTICLLIHATADVNLQIPANAMLLILLLALPIAMSSMNPEAVTDNSSSEK